VFPQIYDSLQQEGPALCSCSAGRMAHGKAGQRRIGLAAAPAARLLGAQQGWML